MDPLTASLVLAGKIIDVIMAVRADMPLADRQQSASDTAKLIHNIADFMLALQSKINAAVGVK
jgi:hypothetical protein